MARSKNTEKEFKKGKIFIIYCSAKFIKYLAFINAF